MPGKKRMFRGKKILFIEDISDTVEGTSAKLRYHGCAVDLSPTIEAGEKALKIEKYDAIILDWWLPESTGGDIIKNGGEIILKNLRGGKYGKNNKETTVIIYTQHLDRLGLYETACDKLCYSLVSKLTPPSDVVEELKLIWKDCG